MEKYGKYMCVCVCYYCAVIVRLSYYVGTGGRGLLRCVGGGLLRCMGGGL